MGGCKGFSIYLSSFNIINLSVRDKVVYNLLGSVLKDLGYWESGIHGKRGIL
jgi:hypothetical protein